MSVLFCDYFDQIYIGCILDVNFFYLRFPISGQQFSLSFMISNAEDKDEDKVKSNLLNCTRNKTPATVYQIK